MASPDYNLFWFNQPSAVERRHAYFLVLTTGNCGAIWFASALNLHEEIFAACGTDHPIQSCFQYSLNKDSRPLVLASTPLHYRFGAHPDLMPEILRQHGREFDIRTQRDYERLAWNVFDELEDLPGADRYTVLGSIHAFSAEQFARCYEQDHAILRDRRVVVTNMIRHPVTRTESYIQAFIMYQLAIYKNDIDEYIRQNGWECRRLETTYGISMDDPRVRAALFTYRMEFPVQRVADELRAFRGMLPLKMEDLQSDPDYFASAVAVLTSGRVTADAAYLEKVYRPENLGLGRRHVPEGTRPTGPAAQWEAWPEWERREFKTTCMEHGIDGLYEEYGYDFSFMK